MVARKTLHADISFKEKKNISFHSEHFYRLLYDYSSEAFETKTHNSNCINSSHGSVDNPIITSMVVFLMSFKKPINRIHF